MVILEKVIMKRKVLLLLLLILCFVSCDISEPFVIDGKKEYVVSTDCGTINLRGSSIQTLSILLSCKFQGKYHINIDSLKMRVIPNEIKITNIHFRFNNKDIVEKVIETKVDESLTMMYNLESSTPFRRSEATILILPSDFITCDDKPIITDTIRIQLKN